MWLDGLRRDSQGSATMFFKPEGEAAAGRVASAWCNLPAAAPANAQCAHVLEEPLPVGPSRSFAWANTSTLEGLGERVITGLADGVSLRLDGSEFTRVLSLGGEEGAGFGAAFSDPHEGWLGKQALPVHLTPRPPRRPVASRPGPSPSTMRSPRSRRGPARRSGRSTARRLQSATAARSRDISRVRVGCRKRLLGPGGRRRSRDCVRWRGRRRCAHMRSATLKGLGQMWLWRGETGLWEPDPAEP